MTNRRYYFLWVLIFLLVPFTASAKILKICTDKDYWYPYTYVENEKSVGMHIDIVLQALDNLGYEASFTPLPWKRCLKGMEMGRFNAVVSASYKPDREKYMLYPFDTGINKISKWRIMQVSYVVVTHIDSKYKYSGEIKNLPQPVRAPFGYSIVDFNIM